MCISFVAGEYFVAMVGSAGNDSCQIRAANPLLTRQRNRDVSRLQHTRNSVTGRHDEHLPCRFDLYLERSVALVGNDGLRVERFAFYLRRRPATFKRTAAQTFHQARRPAHIHHRVCKRHIEFDRHDVDAQRFMACNNTQMMRSLVRQGVGVAVLCWLDVAVDVAAGQMDFRPLRDSHLKPLQRHLCVAARRQLSHGAREVIRYFETGMADAGLT